MLGVIINHLHTERLVSLSLAETVNNESVPGLVDAFCFLRRSAKMINDIAKPQNRLFLCEMRLKGAVRCDVR